MEGVWTILISFIHFLMAGVKCIVNVCHRRQPRKVEPSKGKERAKTSPRIVTPAPRKGTPRISEPCEPVLRRTYRDQILSIYQPWGRQCEAAGELHQACLGHQLRQFAVAGLGRRLGVGLHQELPVHHPVCVSIWLFLHLVRLLLFHLLGGGREEAPSASPCPCPAPLAHPRAQRPPALAHPRAQRPPALPRPPRAQRPPALAPHPRPAPLRPPALARPPTPGASPSPTPTPGRSGPQPRLQPTQAGKLGVSQLQAKKRRSLHDDSQDSSRGSTPTLPGAVYPLATERNSNAKPGK
ncbi:uncharacterized protein LOC129713282 [Leucoraja erinacea]|uniref:uncharacterized protein LOC129713282 n=1 Tax=Leucoraja erinaceus TaxID=7782 RepID=UPI002457CFE9|nr:uncharacterized protein LOC129713282 [Leucoraja erinacea]